MFLDNAVQEKVTFLSIAHGEFWTGSKAKGTKKSHGGKFEGRLLGIKAKAKDPKNQYSKHRWELKLKSADGGVYIIDFPMSDWDTRNFFNSLASIEDFTQPLRINMFLGRPKEGSTYQPNMIFLLKDWDDYKSFYRGKWPYVKRGQQPDPNTMYFPAPVAQKYESGEIAKDQDGRTIYKWNDVNKFIQESIVNMINAKLEGLEPDIMNDSGNEPDFMAEQQTNFPNYQENANKLKETFSKPQGDPGPTAPPEDDDDLPF